MSETVTRRAVLAAGGLGLLAAAGLSPRRAGAAAAPPAGEYTLPPLPYAFDALEPHIDAKTMEIHHDRHHAAYVTNLNAALKDHPDHQGQPIERLIVGLGALPEAIRTAVRNNGGGHYNHTMFWVTMKPDGGGPPSGALAQAIEADFGGFDPFKEAFTKAASGRFGSGWAWLVARHGKLAVTSTANQDNPLMDVIADDQKGRPLLGLDVWEHAYYLKYQNKRADYIAAWWNTVNWAEVARRFEST
jgi:superoxide dismutase, Fe-Mn family